MLKYNPLEIHKKTGLSQTALYDYLKTPKKLTLWRVEVIAKAMNQDPTELAAQILNDSELVEQHALPLGCEA